MGTGMSHSSTKTRRHVSNVGLTPLSRITKSWSTSGIRRSSWNRAHSGGVKK